MVSTGQLTLFVVAAVLLTHLRGRRRYRRSPIDSSFHLVDGFNQSNRDHHLLETAGVVDTIGTRGEYSPS